MQPQQPSPQPPQYPPQPGQTPGGPHDPNDYDFILNPAAAPKKSLFNFGGSFAMRLIAILGGLFILVAILAVLINTMSSSGFDKPGMLAIAQDQTEILRLIDVGEKEAKSQALKDFNITAALSLESSQATFVTYLSSNNVTLKSKDLALNADSSTDTQLDTAVSGGTFDTTYTGIMDKQLAEYQADLSAAYKKAGAKGKAILQAEYNNAKLLRTQLNS